MRILNRMGPNIEPLVYMIKVFGKHFQCHLFLHPVFYVLSMANLHPLTNHMHEVLQQVNQSILLTEDQNTHKNGTNFYCLGIFSSFLKS